MLYCSASHSLKWPSGCTSPLFCSVSFPLFLMFLPVIQLASKYPGLTQILAPISLIRVMQNLNLELSSLTLSIMQTELDGPHMLTGCCSGILKRVCALASILAFPLKSTPKTTPCMVKGSASFSNPTKFSWWIFGTVQHHNC